MVGTLGLSIGLGIVGLVERLHCVDNSEKS